MLYMTLPFKLLNKGNFPDTINVGQFMLLMKFLAFKNNIPAHSNQVLRKIFQQLCKEHGALRAIPKATLANHVGKVSCKSCPPYTYDCVNDGFGIFCY